MRNEQYFIGKLVDILAAHYDYVARFNGGANAGTHRC